MCEGSAQNIRQYEKLIKLENILYGFKFVHSCKGQMEEVYISCAPYISAMAMKCIISISISNLNDHMTFIWGFLMLLLAIICQTFLSNCQRTPHEVNMWITRRNQIVKTLLFCGIQLCFDDKISVIRHSGFGQGFQETPYKLKTNQRNKSNILKIKESVCLWLCPLCTGWLLIGWRHPQRIVKRG